MSTPSSLKGRKIAVLAGGGQLPLELARELRRAGAAPHIVALDGIADSDFSEFNVVTVALGEVGRMLDALRQGGTRDMVIAGYVRRPDLLRLRIDLGFIRHLPTILSLMRGGDDSVMRRVANFFERHGLAVRGAGDVAPALLAPEGPLAGSPTPGDIEAARLGQHVIALLAPYDVGQAVIIDEGALKAIEGVEGTDALLKRVGQTQRRRVLVKTAKPGQDLRLDLPTIGARTIRAAAESNVSLTALEAHHTLIVDRSDTCAIAARTKMTIVGLAPLRASPLARAAFEQRLQAIGLKPLGSLRAGERARSDAQTGLALLEDLAKHAVARAALVARQHVLAINVDEPLEAFVARTRHSGQWGDGARRRRNATLVIGRDYHLTPADMRTLAQTSVAGIAFSKLHGTAEERSQMIDRAREASLYLLERS